MQDLPSASPSRRPQAARPDERHSRKCQVCNHPEREVIEEEYLDWFTPYRVARHYNIPERALYRHFRAIGLVGQRRENMRVVIDRILERGAETQITGDVILRAVRAQCCLTDNIKWVEPAKEVVFSVVYPEERKVRPDEARPVVAKSPNEPDKPIEILIDSEPIRR